MKKNLLFLGIVVLLNLNQIQAQCTTANLNWDNLDFLVNTGNYAGFVTAAQTRNQRFALGIGAVQMVVTNNITVNGENSTYTGTTNTYGAGASVSFATTTTTGTSSITLRFDSLVSSLRFSIYDIDNNQRVAVSAFNGATPVSSTLSIAGGSGSGMTFTTNPGNTPRANGIAGDYAVTDNRGAVNVDITLAVDSVVLTFTNATGDFWLSDLRACVPGSFPTNYHGVSQPWPGQPSYITGTSDTNVVHSIDPATGAVKILFQDPAHVYVNALGYDPVNKHMIYVPDDINAAVVQKGLKKYDFNTETISTITTDVSLLGIPLFDAGVESGGGAYYAGAYYLGIEGGNSGNNSNRESIIWRIDMDASNNVISVCQVMALPADNGSGTKSHDWGDFVISNGILYDWDTGNLGSTRNIYHYNLQTGNMDATYSPGTPSGFITPRQVSVTWDNRIYFASTYITRYNGAGANTGSSPTIAGPGWVVQPGDAGEAFRPKADYGDAPSSYDPSASPAVHEMDVNLRLGNTFDREWLKEGTTITADADGADEDGISTAPILCPCSGNFFIPVRVYNNTGSNATLIAWLDYNGNGSFESTEALTATVPSSASTQIINLSWTNAWTSIPDNSFTYLRIRLASSGLTPSTPTGYFANGEVEDYRVLVDGFPLAMNVMSFTAIKDRNDNAQLTWRVNEDVNLSYYHIQKSSNSKDWVNIGIRQASGKSGIIQHTHEDASILNGTTYYRLQLVSRNGASRLSVVRQLSANNGGAHTFFPNPAHKKTALTVTAGSDEKTTVYVTNAAGAVVHRKSIQLKKGINTIDIDVTDLPAGIYTVQMRAGKGNIVEQLVKN